MTTTLPSQKESPMMAQWHQCKRAAPDAIVFFRLGDFYEAFYDDAVLVAKELELTLTQRQGVPMSGVPHHTCEGYVDRLVAKGYRVAVAEQVEDARQAKGLVKREIVRIVTPGTVVNSSLLSDKLNNFFVAIAQVGAVLGMTVLDLTTGECRAIEVEEMHEMINELHRLHPAEILVSERFKEKHLSLFEEMRRSFNFLLTTREEWHFDHQIAYEFLVRQFRVHSLDGFGLKGMVAAVNATGALLSYLSTDLCFKIDHIREIATYALSEYMSIDQTTQRNLELTESLQEGRKRNTLLEVIDKTQTPMGGRLLLQWIKHPLMSISRIQARQECVEAFFRYPLDSERLAETLGRVRDLERLMMKISSAYATPRDLLALRLSLEQLPLIKTILERITAPAIATKASLIQPLENVVRKIAEALVDDPPVRLSDGGVIREQFHPQLDELRELSRDSKSWLARYQNQLREETNIKTLKVSYNKIFGFYIEVSKGQADKMPAHFQRRQTLVNTERFISPELKEYESRILTAEERMSALESELFNTLRTEVAAAAGEVLTQARILAKLDCLNAFARVAREYRYVRPLLDEGNTLQIVEGRHPVIEASSVGQKFIPNDTLLDNAANRLMIITGPNMAGKSTYIRQVALITILAQMGSFVPATSAHIGLVDKVFTRIGASDDLSRGQSTFMVEMSETANILNNATARSLVILDEIGRGTSTYDGVSIAWAVAEYLLTAKGKTAKTLFATHYWELTQLEGQLDGAVNYNVAIREYEDQIIFLHKIVKGGTDKSYGIHVARLAGLPLPVIQRAREILTQLEISSPKGTKSASSPRKGTSGPKIQTNGKEIQLTLFQT